MYSGTVFTILYLSYIAISQNLHSMSKMKNANIPIESFLILNSLAGYIFIVDEEWNCVFYNSAARQHFGIADGHLNPADVHIPLADKELLRVTVLSAMQSAGFVEEIVWIQTSGSLCPYSAIFSKNSTETICIEIKPIHIASSEWLIHIPSGTIYGSASAANVQSWEELIHPDDRESVRSHCGSESSDKPAKIKYRIRGVGNTWDNIIEERETIGAVSLQSRIVSADRASSLSVSDTTQHICTVADTFSVPIVLTSVTGIVRYANKKAHDFFGNDTEIVGKIWEHDICWTHSVRQVAKYARVPHSKPTADTGGNAQHTIRLNIEGEDIDIHVLTDTGVLASQLQATLSDKLLLEQKLVLQKFLAELATNITDHTKKEKNIVEMLAEIGAVLEIDRISLTNGYSNAPESYFWSSPKASSSIDIQKYFDQTAEDFLVASARRGWPEATKPITGTMPEGAVININLYGPKGYSGYLQAEKHGNGADWSENEIDFFRSVKNVFEVKIDLAESHAELIEAKEMAEASNLAKSEFFANISHEIRTPLNAMLGFSQVLFDKKFDAESRFTTASILKNGNALHELLNDVIELSKIEAGITEYPLAFSSIQTLFEQLKQLFASAAEAKSIDFSFQYNSDIPRNLLINMAFVKQILVKLIANAFKFTESGNVHISARSTHQGNETGNLYIQIKDTGIGIEEHIIRKIFEPFFQNEQINTKSFSGVGLGLTIVKKLLAKVNGTIEVTSSVGFGSSFVICIPDILGNSTPEKPELLNTGIFNFRNSAPEIFIVTDRDRLTGFVHSFFSNSENIRQLTGNFQSEDIPFDTADIIIIDLQSQSAQATEMMMIQRSKSAPLKPVCIAIAPFTHTSTYCYDGYFLLPLHQKQIYNELVRLAGRIKEVQIHRELAVCDTDICPITITSTLLSELRAATSPIVANLSDGIVLNDVDKLTAALYEIGSRHDSQWCSQTAQKLDDALQAFDLFRIDYIISEFNKSITKEW